MGNEQAVETLPVGTWDMFGHHGGLGWQNKMREADATCVTILLASLKIVDKVGDARRRRLPLVEEVIELLVPAAVKIQPAILSNQHIILYKRTCHEFASPIY